MKRFYLLDPLRGLAALWVLLYHYDLSAETHEAMPIVLRVFKHGHLGVPMFFVISGICIAAAAKNCLNRAKPTSEFIYRRLCRIYPPFWFSICVAACLPFAMEFLSSLKSGTYSPPDRANPNLAFLNYTPLDWASVASLLRVFDTSSFAMTLPSKFTGINAVYWTLALEVQFYLAIAFALWFRRWFYQILICLTLLGMSSRLVPAAFNSGVFLPYWPLFALGVLLFAMFESGWEPASLWPNWATVISVVAMGFGLPVLAFVLATKDHINQASLPAACIFSVVLFFAKGLDPWFGRWFESNRLVCRSFAWPIVGLGMMSYSVYLVHCRLQYLVVQVLRQVLTRDSMVFDCAVIVIVLAICAVFYWVCERPFIGRSNKQSRATLPNSAAAHAGQVVTP